MKEEKTFIGIDVSKEKLDVGVRPQVDFMTFANTEDGISLLTDFVKSKQPELIVLEATGVGNGCSQILGCCKASRSLCQSQTGERFCQSYGCSGQDG
jgi:hypothetical protein